MESRGLCGTKLWGRSQVMLVVWALNCTPGTTLGVGKLMATVLRVIPVSARVDVEVLGEW
ncbi:hypothetical protein CQZ76_00330 [Anaplasma marginale]|nr:hypothetical protein CQZ76_00175 [Anaplasma marginale]AXW83733.1 hypothetical protein CQZ76_00330 [Anaplasma marginale]